MAWLYKMAEISMAKAKVCRISEFDLSLVSTLLGDISAAWNWLLPYSLEKSPSILIIQNMLIHGFPYPTTACF
jgi:hypothetical protein